MTMHVPEPGTADAAGIELADGRRRPHGFVEAGYDGVTEGGAPRAAVVAMREGGDDSIVDDRDGRGGFAYLGNQMGGYGDARARELTAALHASIGA
jgi:hypothetical protein